MQFICWLSERMDLREFNDQHPLYFSPSLSIYSLHRGSFCLLTSRHGVVHPSHSPLLSPPVLVDHLFVIETQVWPMADQSHLGTYSHVLLELLIISRKFSACSCDVSQHVISFSLIELSSLLKDVTTAHAYVHFPCCEPVSGPCSL